MKEPPGFLQHVFPGILSTISVAVALPLPGQAANEKAPTAHQQAMMEARQTAATLGSNHQLLATLNGQWTFTTKMWMEPGAPPETSTGTAAYTPLIDDVMKPGTKVKVRQIVKVLGDDSHVMEWYEFRGWERDQDHGDLVHPPNVRTRPPTRSWCRSKRMAKMWAVPR